MPIGVQLVFRGVTLGQYDQINEWMGLLPGGPAPQRALFHWVTSTDDGFRITDVWESRSAFQQFAQESLGPALKAIGVAVPSDVQVFPVYNFLAGGRARS